MARLETATTLLLAGLTLAGLTLATPAGAFPLRGNDQNPLLAEAERLIDAGRYELAIEILNGVLAADPDSADALSQLGFAHRKLGRLEPSLEFYNRALAIDPDHLEAHEYLGELHLVQGDLAAATAQLDTLVRLCPEGCEPREELEAAIAAFPNLPGD